MNVDEKNWFVRKAMALVQHYDHEAYWRMRAEVVDPQSRKSKLTRLWYLYRIKRADAFANASMGTDLGAGAKILGAVHIGDGAKIGANAVVVSDVPAYATAVGVPARIILKEEKEKRATP